MAAHPRLVEGTPAPENLGRQAGGYGHLASSGDVYHRPVPYERDDLLTGPFKSQVEYEEFCDRCNAALEGSVPVYDAELFNMLIRRRQVEDGSRPNSATEEGTT